MPDEKNFRTGFRITGSESERNRAGRRGKDQRQERKETKSAQREKSKREKDKEKKPKEKKEKKEKKAMWSLPFKKKASAKQGEEPLTEASSELQETARLDEELEAEEAIAVAADAMGESPETAEGAADAEQASEASDGAQVKDKKVNLKGIASKFGISIRTQLILGFAVPIVFMVLIGWISYVKAYNGLTENYESSAYTAVEMTMSSLDASMKTINSITLELAQDNTVNSYALGGYDNSHSKMQLAQNTIRDNLNVKETSSELISGIDIIPITGDEVITTRTLSSATRDSFISELAESEDAGMLADSFVHWGSSHPCVDQNLEVDPEGYILYCSKAFKSGDRQGVVVIDVSYEGVKNLLEGLKFGDDSLVSFSTADGRSINIGEELDISSVGDEVESNTYVRVDGDTYFYMKVDSSVTGGNLKVFVPKSYITSGTKAIRNITVSLVVIAVLVAFGIGAIITMGITKNIQKNVAKLDKVSQGELIALVEKENSSHSEFGKLHTALGNTINKMRDLILTVSRMKDEVLVSGEKVKNSSDELNFMIESVSGKMEEINDIIGSQNAEITGCNEQMEQLSVRIKTVSGSLMDTIEQVENSKGRIDDGMQTVEQMVHQSEDTAQATNEVREQVENLGQKLTQISKCVKMIQDIAEQTNLLSLNASIEAARAGEQGRGFSVVAEEIRKLADNSGSTATEIHKMIEEISSYSSNAIDKVLTATTISKNQVESAQRTIEAFNSINELMEQLLQNMQSVAGEVDEMNGSRHQVLKEVHAISESSANTVRSTEEVNLVLEKQQESAVILQTETDRMRDNMEQLEAAIATFKL